MLYFDLVQAEPKGRHQFFPGGGSTTSHEGTTAVSSFTQRPAPHTKLRLRDYVAWPGWASGYRDQHVVGGRCPFVPPCRVDRSLRYFVIVLGGPFNFRTTLLIALVPL